MTSDDPVQPDPIVRTALQLLPIPPHEPSFWSDLETALDAEAPPTVASAAPPGPGATIAAPAAAVVELVPDRALVPAGVRRRSNVVLSAVAVAAAVMVVVAGTALVRQRGGTDTDPTELADEAGDPLDTELTSTSTAGTSRSTLTGTGEGSVPTSAVLAWLDALGAGDTDAAWAALGPASQAHFGSKSAFSAEGTALAEGYGAWSAASPDAVYVTSLVASGDGEVVIVTLVGTLEQEGVAQERADAFPVRVVDGRARLEPFAFAGELEIVVPEPVPAGGTRSVVHDDEVVVVVPRGIDAPMVRLDDGETLVCGEAAGTEPHGARGAPGQRCSYLPAGRARSRGEHTLTVAFLGPTAPSISAESVLLRSRLKPGTRGPTTTAILDPRREPSLGSPVVSGSFSDLLRDYLTVGIFGLVGAGPGRRCSSVPRERSLRPTRPQAEKYINYESGVDPVGSGWGQSQVRYYIFALLFVMFDVEAVFIFPCATQRRGLRVVRPGRDGRSSS